MRRKIVIWLDSPHKARVGGSTISPHMSPSKFTAGSSREHLIVFFGGPGEGIYIDRYDPG